MKEIDIAIKWMKVIFQIDVDRMIADGILKKKEILRTYRHAKERGLTGNS